MRFCRLLSVFVMMSALSMWFTARTARAQGGAAPQAGGAPAAPAAPPFRMNIPGWADGADIPVKYTQAGNQTSPEITWTNVPPGTVSFLLSVHDMEVSRNKTTDDQVHWLVWNIPGTATGLPEGVPMGAQMQNGASQISVSGPVFRGPGAPAAGPKHHYTFELFALDSKPDVQAGADAFETRANAIKAIQGHILAKSVYVGLFHRPQ
jgi:Raf kinase inhibitor-like YbhB/YbcL family protein